MTHKKNKNYKLKTKELKWGIRLQLHVKYNKRKLTDIFFLLSDPMDLTELY